MAPGSRGRVPADVARVAAGGHHGGRGLELLRGLGGDVPHPRGQPRNLRRGHLPAGRAEDVGAEHGEAEAADGLHARHQPVLPRPPRDSRGQVSQVRQPDAAVPTRLHAAAARGHHAFKSSGRHHEPAGPHGGALQPQPPEPQPEPRQPLLRRQPRQPLRARAGPQHLRGLQESCRTAGELKVLLRFYSHAIINPENKEDDILGLGQSKKKKILMKTFIPSKNIPYQTMIYETCIPCICIYIKYTFIHYIHSVYYSIYSTYIRCVVPCSSSIKDMKISTQ